MIVDRHFIYFNKENPKSRVLCTSIGHHHELYTFIFSLQEATVSSLPSLITIITTRNTVYTQCEVGRSVYLLRISQ